jgi:thiamine pyrophosphokinase
MTTTVVFGGGPIDRDAADVALLGVRADRVIAADSGLATCVAAGLHCDLVVGDMDSVSPELLEAACAAGTVIERHERDKDATDLELALDHAVQGPDGGTVLLIGSSGGRLDHLFSIALLVGSPRYSGFHLEARLGRSRVLPVHDQRRIFAPVGTVASLFAFHGPANGVTVTGMRWPLSSAVLDAGNTVGVSNRFDDDAADFTVQGGVLTVVIPGQREF